MRLFGSYSDNCEKLTLRSLYPSFRTQCSRLPVILMCFTFLWLLVLSSCATQPIANNSNCAPILTISPDTEILVLRPLARFEKIEDETILSPNAKFHSTERCMLAIIKDVVGSPTFVKTSSQMSKELAGAGLAEEAEITELCEQLRSKTPKLSRGIISKDANMLIKHLSSCNENTAVLVSFIRAKVGRRGYWDPSSGAIASSTSKTILQAALIQCSTCQVLWRNQVLLRKLPNADDPDFLEAVKLVYKNFPQR